MTTINLKIDQLMLRWMKGESSVGIYSVAVTLSESWYFIAMAIVASVNPLLVRTRTQNMQKYSTSVQRVYDLLFTIALSVAIFVNIVARPLITLVYGHPYAGAASILVIHVWAGLFAFIHARANVRG